jgi:hypothetical protein
MPKPVLSLQPSETALLGAAAQIFSAYVASGHVTGGNESDMMDRSVSEALQMARRIEEVVQGDNELG